MNEADVAEWVRAPSKNEHLILTAYEGGGCIPEEIVRY